MSATPCAFIGPARGPYDHEHAAAVTIGRGGWSVHHVCAASSHVSGSHTSGYGPDMLEGLAKVPA